MLISTIVSLAAGAALAAPASALKTKGPTQAPSSTFKVIEGGKSSVNAAQQAARESARAFLRQHPDAAGKAANDNVSLSDLNVVDLLALANDTLPALIARTNDPDTLKFLKGMLERISNGEVASYSPEARRRIVNLLSGLNTITGPLTKQSVDQYMGLFNQVTREEAVAKAADQNRGPLTDDEMQKIRSEAANLNMTELAPACGM